MTGPATAQVVVPDMKLPPMTPTPCRVKMTPARVMSDPAAASRIRVTTSVRSAGPGHRGVGRMVSAAAAVTILLLIDMPAPPARAAPRGSRAAMYRKSPHPHRFRRYWPAGVDQGPVRGGLAGGEAVQEQGFGQAGALEGDQVQALVGAVGAGVGVLHAGDEDLGVREALRVGGHERDRAADPDVQGGPAPGLRQGLAGRLVGLAAGPDGERGG